MVIVVRKSGKPEPPLWSPCKKNCWPLESNHLAMSVFIHGDKFWGEILCWVAVPVQESHLLTGINILFQIQLADLTSEKHKLQEQLRTSVEHHQRVLSTYQQKLATLQEECSAAKVFSRTKKKVPFLTTGLPLRIFILTRLHLGKGCLKASVFGPRILFRWRQYWD